MYVRGMEMLGLSFVWKLGLHPVTLVCVAVIWDSFP
jgi:hypothetical protein